MKRHLLFLLWALLQMSWAIAKEPQPASPRDAVDARLVNGPSRCSGHLEMKHQGQWRTMMLGSSEQSSRAVFAEMACRQMDCGSVISFKFHINATVPKSAWEVDFPCQRNELTIRECIGRGFHKKVEDINSTVSSITVECSESLRVTDQSSFNSCSGKVMVKSGQNWIPVCELEPPKDQELMLKMMCAELGCGPPVNDQRSSFESMEVQTVVKSRIIQCHSNETRLEDCPTSPHSNCTRVLHISCQNPNSVRLVGESGCRGVVEGKDWMEWRPLRHQWYLFQEKALVDLCKELGCGTFLSATKLYLSHNVPLWGTGVQCSGCPLWKYWSDTDGQIVMNITCTETVRLVGGPNRCTGYVEVKHEDNWQNMCHDGFALRHALVACRDLQCGFPGELQRPKGRYDVRNTLSLNCSGHEEHLVACPVASLPAEGADKECNAAFLYCGRAPIGPKVTMFSRLADVQPKELVAYCGHRVHIICSINSPSRVGFFLLTFSAHGPKKLIEKISAVDNAAHFVFEAAELNQTGYYYCSYNYEFRPDVLSDDTEFFIEVKEASYVELVGARRWCLGSLKLKHKGEWRAVSQQQWSLKEAAVVCRQLHCGSVISTDTQSRELQPVWRFYSDCDGSERALLSCGDVREWMSSTTVHVLCSDTMAPPNITILSDRLHPENTEHVVVTEGHSFFIKCSVEGRFPGGHFSLSFSGSEKVNLTKPAIRYSAVFIFGKVSKDHSGNYSCLYHNTVSQHHFTFESNTVTITVEESRDIILDDGQQRDDGSKACSGTLLMRDGTSQMKMVTAETSGWDMRQASVVCRQLSCGSAVSTSKIELQTFTSMWRFFSDCDGSETALLDCGHIDEWFSTTAIQVVCAGNS